MKKLTWILLVGPWLLAGEAQAAPTVITTCQAITQPGAYVLAHNLSATGNCIRLKSDGVTLNLNGFEIVGNGSGTAIKFAAECGCSGRQIVIEHGLIIGFARAIDLAVLGGGPTTYVLEDLRISDNAEFGARLEGESMVRNSVFYKNGICLFLDGCARATEPGDGLTVGNNSIVTGNIAVGNAHSGIVAGAAATITGNTVNSNGFIGISVGGGATLANNTVNANTNAGISVACPSNLQANTATANTPNVSTSGSGCLSEHNLAPYPAAVMAALIASAPLETNGQDGVKASAAPSAHGQAQVVGRGLLPFLARRDRPSNQRPRGNAQDRAEKARGAGPQASEQDAGLVVTLSVAGALTRLVGGAVDGHGGSDPGQETDAGTETLAAAATAGFQPGNCGARDSNLFRGPLRLKGQDRVVEGDDGADEPFPGDGQGGHTDARR